MWTREFQQARGVQSMKAFMFFTWRLRNRYTHNLLFVTRPYKWWFHVAPFTYVGNREFVLDREFLPQAVPLEDWTFQFIGKVDHDNKDVPNPTRSEAACLDATGSTPVFAGCRSGALLRVRKVPMFYFQPLDVEALDCKSGAGTACSRTVVSGWRDSELQRAYKDTAK